jgi:hypothetical protein
LNLPWAVTGPREWAPLAREAWIWGSVAMQKYKGGEGERARACSGKC